jgi:hypothetical protein
MLDILLKSFSGYQQRDFPKIFPKSLCWLNRVTDPFDQLPNLRVPLGQMAHHVGNNSVCMNLRRRPNRTDD